MMGNIFLFSIMGKAIMTAILLIILISAGHCNTDYDTSSQLNEFTGKINQYLFSSSQGSASTMDTLIWSPLSVYSLLDPLIDAAGGSTYTELNALLHFSKFTSKTRELSTTYSNSLDDVHSTKINANNATPQRFSITPEEPIMSITSPPVQGLSTSSPTKRCLKTATGLFISKQFKLNNDFLKSLQSKSNELDGLADRIDIKSLDLSLSSKLLASQINEWINTTTDGLIQTIIQPDNFDKETKMIIVSGVKFKGEWKSKFRPFDTETTLFYGNQGNTQVKMMFQRSTQDFKKFEKEGFQALKLSYADNDMKLLFILPKDPLVISSIMRSLTSARIAQIIEQLEPTELDIYLPKFQVETNVPIKFALMKAGLKSLFSRIEANLTRMLDFSIPCAPNNSSGEPIPLYLNDIVHKTVFEIDEEGTKAGAATAGFFVPLSGLMNHRIQNFTLNKPFIFIIRDAKSSIIFQGVITNIPGESTVTLNPTTMKFNNASDPVLFSRSNTKENSVTDNGWWVHNRTPEYLHEVDGSSVKIAGDKIKSKDKILMAENYASKQNQNELFFKSGAKPTPRFQQPEPEYPEGIRFPHPGAANVSDEVYQSHSKNRTHSIKFHGIKIANNL